MSHVKSTTFFIFFVLDWTICFESWNEQIRKSNNLMNRTSRLYFWNSNRKWSVFCFVLLFLFIAYFDSFIFALIRLFQTEIVIFQKDWITKTKLKFQVTISAHLNYLSLSFSLFPLFFPSSSSSLVANVCMKIRQNSTWSTELRITSITRTTEFRRCPDTSHKVIFLHLFCDNR